MKYHQPVLLKESVEGLKIKPYGVYVDATFGGGGHSREILNCLQNGRLIAFDQDEEAVANVPEDKRIIFVRHNFRFLRNFLKYYEIDQIDGLIADLGVSSYHFDAPQRGFSFRFDSKLDMRMNTKATISASEIINSYSSDKLAKVFFNYGELRNARLLAGSIVNSRNNSPITSTVKLLDCIKPHLPKHKENQYLAKIFQALRIEVNHELDNLRVLLQQSVEFLKSEARIVIISYHSLEDRIVKNFFRYGSFETNQASKDMFGNIQRPFEPVNRKVIVPSEEELKRNSRARSAKLRIAQKVGE
jgi:16S rRNA (cytosine1402-N4)-methyltransferase